MMRSILTNIILVIILYEYELVMWHGRIRIKVGNFDFLSEFELYAVRAASMCASSSLKGITPTSECLLVD
jgi:hypothetical protein